VSALGTKQVDEVLATPFDLVLQYLLNSKISTFLISEIHFLTPFCPWLLNKYRETHESPKAYMIHERVHWKHPKIHRPNLSISALKACKIIVSNVIDPPAAIL
jgi:hypothetical protein